MNIRSWYELCVLGFLAAAVGGGAENAAPQKGLTHCSIDSPCCVRGVPKGALRTHSA